eukprot:3236461-Prorocentrum_lima.AAC.1
MEFHLDYNLNVNPKMDLCGPGLLAWAKDQEVHYMGGVPGGGSPGPRSRPGDVWGAWSPGGSDDEEWCKPS